MSIKRTKKQGFTLIELLVSVSLFSVVLVVTLGSIITIADSNKKARSLMSVMNNLNFSVDSMTRSIKVGKVGASPVSAGGTCLTTQEINYNASDLFQRQLVEYCLDVDPITELGTITKRGPSGTAVPLTSPDVDVDYMNFIVYYGDGNQPRISIVIEGTVKISEKINSNFTIQTTVAQRQLNI